LNPTNDPYYRIIEAGFQPVVAAPEKRRYQMVRHVCADGRPVFVGFNAPFDWMFVADYFYRYIGRNPFGISALDLKSFYMGRSGVSTWVETRRVHVDERLGLQPDHTHHALEDARGQAALARVLLRATLDHALEE